MKKTNVTSVARKSPTKQPHFHAATLFISAAYQHLHRNPNVPSVKRFYLEGIDINVAAFLAQLKKVPRPTARTEDDEIDDESHTKGGKHRVLKS
jgi:hypothetical protein